MKRCPCCKPTRTWKLGDGRLKCQPCGCRYRVKSVWEASRLPQAVKRRLLELFVLGGPSYRQRFRSRASAPARERFYRLIRACCAGGEHLREPFVGAVECDETTFGGVRPGKRGWGAAGKVIVLGILQRNGLVRVVPVQGRHGHTSMALVRQHPRPGSLYDTDDWHAYASLAIRGDHIVVRKERGRPKGRDHLNGIEGFWSYAKKWLYPFRGVPRKVFHLYLGEICYQFNHRDKDLSPLLYKLLTTTPFTDVESILVQAR